MKKIALTLCALSIVALSFGQENKKADKQEKKEKEKQEKQVNIDQSKLQLNAGIGLGYYSYYPVLPIYVGVDYWVTEDITAGLEGIFRVGHHMAVGGNINGNYHFARLLDLADKFDFYGGLSAGPFIVFGAPSPLRFDIHLQAGGRYKITDKMWVHGELSGGSLSGAKFGITLRR